MSDCGKSVGFSLILLFLAWHVALLDARAERILIRGRRGPIVVNRGGGILPNRGANQIRTLSPNLVVVNGRIFERNRFNQLRPLFIDRNTGRLINASEPGTAQQLAAVYARNLDRFPPGPQRDLIETFLRAQGVDPNRVGSNVGLPPVAGDPNPSPTGPLPGGPHGNGSGGVTNPFGKEGRVPAEAVPVGGDGKVLPTACRDLNAAICGSRDPKQEDALVDREILNRKRGFLAQSGVSGGAFQQAISSILVNGNPALESIYQGFFNSVKAAMPDISGIVNSVKANLKKAIDAQGLPAEMKSRLDRLNFIVGVPPTDKNGRLDRRKLAGWAQGCRTDGMAPGAFAVEEADDVVICPGLILRSLVLGGTNDIEKQLMHVLGHESTHHMGADVDFDRQGRIVRQSPFRPKFQKLLACFQSRFSGINALRMGGEMAADFLGIKGMVERLRGASPEEAFKAFRSALGILCGSPDDGVHPSGAFRIRVILGEDPEVRQLLGCPATDESCTLAGRRNNL